MEYRCLSLNLLAGPSCRVSRRRFLSLLKLLAERRGYLPPVRGLVRLYGLDGLKPDPIGRELAYRRGKLDFLTTLVQIAGQRDRELLRFSQVNGFRVYVARCPCRDCRLVSLLHQENVLSNGDRVPLTLEIHDPDTGSPGIIRHAGRSLIEGSIIGQHFIELGVVAHDCLKMGADRVAPRCHALSEPQFLQAIARFQRCCWRDRAGRRSTGACWFGHDAARSAGDLTQRRYLSRRRGPRLPQVRSASKRGSV